MALAARFDLLSMSRLEARLRVVWRGMRFTSTAICGRMSFSPVW